MKIEKAIELNEESARSLRDGKHLDYADAVQLGIEALKFRLLWEQQEGEDDPPLLPGETKE